MISKITLENFFSFRSPTTIVLNPDINILLGINGSGKSNFIKSIRFLQESVIGSGLEKIFLQEWSGFDSIANFSTSEKNHIKLSFEFDKHAISKIIHQDSYQFLNNPIYDISIFKSGPTSYYLKEKLYSRSVRSDEDDFIYMDMNNAQGTISTREEGKVGIQKYSQGEKLISFKSTELVLRQISDPNRFYPLFTLKRALEELSAYYCYDTMTYNSPIRQPSSYNTATKLLPEGQNLVTILSNIKNGYSPEYDKIEGAIEKINPYFKDIDFRVLGSKLYLVLREKHLTKSISIEHISDGTLRYILLLSILYNPQRGGLVCIDEPEMGLHPDMINTISDAIKHASKSTQLIIATHSPLLLNAFDIDDVLIFDKNSQNETVVRSSPFDEFGECYENFLVGQAWVKGLIGGKRW